MVEVTQQRLCDQIRTIQRKGWQPELQLQIRRDMEGGGNMVDMSEESELTQSRLNPMILRTKYIKSEALYGER